MNYDIDKIKRKLLIKYPYFGRIISTLKYIEDENCYDHNGNPSAGTDSYNIYYHPKFMNRLTEEEQLFIFAHEISHIANNHIKRSKGKDPETWNIATDAVINANLKDDGLTMVEGGVDIPEAIDYDAESFYEKLMKEQQNQDKKEKKKEKHEGRATHRMWDDSTKKQQASNESKQKESQSILDRLLKKEKKQNPNQGEKNRIEELEKEIERLSKQGENEIYIKNREQKQKEFEKRKNQRTKQALGAGNTTKSEKIGLDNIGVSKRLVDWRRLLKQNTKSLFDWSYQNATIEYGVVTPHLEKIEQSETEILLDTSGSISKEFLRNFLRECKNILKDSKLKVGCFDTEFYGFHTIKTEEDIDSMEFTGGGGTDFNVAVNAFSRNVENRIIFTDGWANMPEKQVDAIWIIFGGKEIAPKGGRVIYIDQERLESLQTPARHR